MVLDPYRIHAWYCKDPGTQRSCKDPFKHPCRIVHTGPLQDPIRIPEVSSRITARILPRRDLTFLFIFFCCVVLGPWAEGTIERVWKCEMISSYLDCTVCPSCSYTSTIWVKLHWIHKPGERKRERLNVKHTGTHPHIRKEYHLPSRVIKCVNTIFASTVPDFDGLVVTAWDNETSIWRKPNMRGKKWKRVSFNSSVQVWKQVLLYSVTLINTQYVVIIL